MNQPQPKPGSRLREARKSLGLTLRDVATESAAIARERGVSRFQVSPTNLHWIETKGQVPSLHHLYSLARIYGLGLEKVLCWYLEASPGSVDIYAQQPGGPTRELDMCSGARHGLSAP